MYSLFMSPDILRAAIAYLVVYSSYSIIFLSDAQAIALTREDGPVENIGAVLYFLASFLFLAAYLNSSGFGNKLGRINTVRNLFYLLLALLFLLCAAEEISWGQRIFDWKSPQFLLEENAQGETNLHNIKLFHAFNSDGSRKSFMAMLINMNRLLSMFWLSFCVIVPLIDRYSSKARLFFRQVGLPIAPIWLSALFLSHAVFFHFLFNFSTGISSVVLNATNELKESNYAFMFAVFGLLEFRKQKGRKT
jgi:hypothetical protein